MMLLLLFTCNILVLQYAVCYHHSFTHDSVVRHLFHEGRNDRILSRAERHDRLPSSPGNFNHLGNFGDFDQPDSGFNWDENRKRKSLRIFRQSDFVFDDDNEFNDVVVPNRPSSNQRFSSTTEPSTSWLGPSTVRVPGSATRRSTCEDTCRATTQFDPICGDNRVTYTNIYWLRCAQRCGQNVNIKFRGACPRVP